MSFITNEIQHFFSSFESGVIFECTLNKEYFYDALFHEYAITPPSYYHNCSLKRKAEYLGGRYCASLSLACRFASQQQVNTGKHREPIWPLGVVGSISHCATKAIAVTGLNTDYKYVGIDYEEIVSNKNYYRLKQYILAHDEMYAFKQSDLCQERILTLVFSAKESLYKALFPYVKRFFGFKDAKMVCVDLNTGLFQIQLVNQICKDYPIGKVFTGEFRFIGNHVLTLISA